MRDPTAVVVPQHNPNDDSAVLVRWRVADGARVSAGEAIATLETSKATFDIEASRDGHLFYEIVPPATVPVGATIGWLSENSSPREKPSSQHESPPTSPSSESRFTRKAGQLARRHQLQESDFDASLPRIEVSHVERFMSAGAGTDPAVAKSREESEPLEQTPAKMIEAAALSRAYEGAIPSTVAVSLSVDRFAARLQRTAGGLASVTLLELAIFELSRLLAEFPELNGYYAQGRAYRYRSIGIGVAINLGRSLRVPVVPNANALSQVEIARTVRDLSLRYMREELSLEDLTGGTFTVSDLSSFGVVHFIPVLNVRQSAVLGICSDRPGTGTRDLVLTFDHRMSDGMRAARFLQKLRQRLESGD
jgi:2-oxoglutarate dehydrogenase E2 component (dihydrolipoamide succinyltransferase)